MSNPIDLFPARIAFVQIPNTRGALDDMQKGKPVFGYLTPEAVRALRDVLVKLGGPASDNSVAGELQVFAPFGGLDGYGDGGEQPVMVMPSALQVMVREMVLQEIARFVPGNEENTVPQVFPAGEQNIPDVPEEP